MSGKDYDVVKMDFPPYVEEYSPFPDVEPEFNFEEHKEEIYLRNRIIAAQEQARLLKEEERQRLEKQEKFREMTEAAEAATQKRRWDKLVLLDSAIAVIGIIALIVALSGRTSKPSEAAYDSFEKIQTDSIWAEMKSAETTAAFSRTEAATQVSREPSDAKSSEKTTEKEETEIILDKDPFSAYSERIDELLKTTAVREPLEAAEGETVVNTAAMSYKIKNASAFSESKYGRYDTIPGSASVTAEITIKNLTDYDYAVNMIWFNVSAVTYEMDDNGVTVFSGYDEELAEYNERGQLIWLHFDENDLCSFTVTVSNYSFKKDHLNVKYEIDREGIDIKIEIPEDKREVVIVE